MPFILASASSNGNVIIVRDTVGLPLAASIPVYVQDGSCWLPCPYSRKMHPETLLAASSDVFHTEALDLPIAFAISSRTMTIPHQAPHHPWRFEVGDLSIHSLGIMRLCGTLICGNSPVPRGFTTWSQS